MLLDEKEADTEAHEGEKEALWRRIQVGDERGNAECGQRGGGGLWLDSLASCLAFFFNRFWVSRK